MPQIGHACKRDKANDSTRLAESCRVHESNDAGKGEGGVKRARNFAWQDSLLLLSHMSKPSSMNREMSLPADWQEFLETFCESLGAGPIPDPLLECHLLCTAHPMTGELFATPQVVAVNAHDKAGTVTIIQDDDVIDFGDYIRAIAVAGLAIGSVVLAQSFVVIKGESTEAVMMFATHKEFGQDMRYAALDADRKPGHWRSLCDSTFRVLSFVPPDDILSDPEAVRIARIFLTKNAGLIDHR